MHLNDKSLYVYIKTEIMKKPLNKREQVIIAQITLITGVKSIIKSLKTKEVVEVSIETNQRFLSKI